jgi:metal-sulfur cluster biosynthetic enzyme
MATNPCPLELAGAADGLRDRILGELNQIIDPCSRATAVPAGLVDMGLVRALDIQRSEDGAARVSVALCVTHPFCMMPAIFLHEVEKRLKTFPEIASSDVSLDVTTLWTEDLMSEEYRSKLAAQRSNKRLC